MKKLLAILLSLMLLAAFPAALAEAEAPAEIALDASGIETDLKIGILAPAVTHGWVAAVAYNAQLRCEELGVEYVVATSYNAEEMTAQLDDLILQGCLAIVAFPQWEGMGVPIQGAIDVGIIVVNFDISIDAEGVYRLSGDNYDMGVQGAYYIEEKLGGEGDVVILDVPTSGSVAALRKAGFLETLAAMDSKLNVVGDYATQFTREAGLTDFADILTALDHIDAVYSMDDETSIGVLQAIAEAGRTDIKVITGGGGCQEYFHMMPEYPDMWVQSALYSPAMVRDCIDMAIMLHAGEEVPAEVIIPTSLVDRDNYEEYLDEHSPY